MAFFVRQLNAHRVFAGDGFDDAHCLKRHRTRQIFRQGNNLAAFHALRRFDFIACNHGAGSGGHDLHADAEFCQFGFDKLGGLLQFLRVDGNGFALRDAQQVDCGFLVFAGRRWIVEVFVVKQRSLDFGRRGDRHGNRLFAVTAAAFQQRCGGSGNRFGFFDHAAGVFRVRQFGNDAFLFFRKQPAEQSEQHVFGIAAGLGHNFQPRDLRQQRHGKQQDNGDNQQAARFAQQPA